MAEKIQKATSLTKKFEYTCEKANLSFSLELEKQDEVKAFRGILQKALTDVEAEIIDEQIISE